MPNLNFNALDNTIADAASQTVYQRYRFDLIRAGEGERPLPGTKGVSFGLIPS